MKERKNYCIRKRKDVLKQGDKKEPTEKEGKKKTY